MSLKKFIPYSFIIAVLALFLYSFTQVDLSLTLSRASFFQTIEKNFQQIGYFNRPLSTTFYLIVIGVLSLYFIYFLHLALKKKIKINTVWKIIGITGVILTFSYVAFSYDLF